MKTLQSVLLSIVFALLAVASYAQSPISSCRRSFDPEGKGISREQHDEAYRQIYMQFSKFREKSKSGLDPGGIEIKSKNPKYSKMYLYADYILSHEMKPDINMVIDLKSPNSGKHAYLYMAYVELAPDAQGNKKEQVLFFFSGYNIRAKKKYNTDTKTAYVKEIAADIDKNPIVVAETQPDVVLEVDEYASGGSPKIKAFGTTTYIYDINSLHPNKIPLTIGKLFQYKSGLKSIKNYETAMLVNYSQNGKTTGTIEYIPKEGGKALVLEHIKKFDENGQLAEAGFEISTSVKTGEKIVGTWNNSTKINIYTDKKTLSLGMDLHNGKTYFTTVFSLPAGIEKNWKNDVRKFNIEPDLLEELRQNLGREPVEDREQFQEFLTNFQRLNEYVIIDETAKNIHGMPVKYIYKGTYNKDGQPHGWGLMYAVNHYDDEYYIGQFKNGMPDGLGIRQDFKLDKPEIRYSSRGMHVGNTLVYGTRIARPAPVYDPNYASNNGYYQPHGYYVTHGDFRQGELNGKGSHIWYQGFDNGIGDLSYGNFQNGKLHGTGSYYDNDEKKVGEFENGNFLSGNSVTDKMYDNNFYPGAVVLYNGKKYVIMNKANGRIYLDGIDVASTANLSLTGERSVQRKVCNICNGTGFLNPTSNTVFSGVTQTQKSYQTGPTGYVVWEKTTTTTTAPVTTHRTNRCTACSGGSAGHEPVPLRPNQR